MHGAARRIGSYHLFEPLSSGGTADVHFGRKVGALGFERIVAIKSAHTGHLANASFRKMLEDEARLLSRIRHPNVIAPVDVLLTDNELFLVLEYVPGETIAEILLRSQKRVPVEIACTIMAGVLRGLHAAHEARDMKGTPLGIIHRDVSPQNILVGEDGVSRVFDFGIALARDRTQTTEEGVLKGKLAYMSPEQLSDGYALDCRTDIFSAGVVLWEMLTGRRLFRASTPALLLEQLQIGVTKPPSAFAPEVSEAIDEAVMRALAHERDERFPTALAFAKELEACAPLTRTDALTQWLSENAGDALRERAKRVQEIEATQVAAEAPTIHAGPREGAERRAEKKGSPVPRGLAALGLGTLVLLFGGAALFTCFSAVDKAPKQRAEHLPTTLVLLPETSSVVAPLPSTPSASVPQRAVPSRSAAPGVPAHLPKGVPHPTPKIRAECDPPYDIDPHGQKVYRRACIR